MARSTVCVFCLSPRLPTDPPEHVFPKWVSRALLQLPGDGLFRVQFDDPTLPSFECKLVEITTSAVCSTCNHGWMSDLESVVSPLLQTAILGNAAVLDPTRHVTISMWAAKTAMMMECAWVERGLPRFVPDDHCHDLFKTRGPRNSTYIWTTSVGYDPATQSFRDGVLSRTKLELEGISTGDRFDGYAITWHFGYLGLQVVCLGIDDESFNTGRRAPLRLPDGQVLPADAFTRQLSPPTHETINWPPPIGLEQIGFGTFATQPPFVVGHRSLS